MWFEFKQALLLGAGKQESSHILFGLFGKRGDGRPRRPPCSLARTEIWENPLQIQKQPRRICPAFEHYNKGLKLLVIQEWAI